MSDRTPEIGVLAPIVLVAVLAENSDKIVARFSRYWDTFSDYVAKAIAKLTDEDRRALQEASLSNADRLELMFQRQAKSGDGQLSKEQFLGRLLADCTPAPSEPSEADNGKGKT